MNIGVVGCGYWGSKHVRVLSAARSVDRVYVIEPAEARRAELLRSFPSTRGAASLTEVLDELDGVVIATKPSTHSQLGLQAIAAGKHVLIEKPLATTVADAKALVAAAEAAGVKLMVGHTFEYNSAVWSLRRMIEDGTLGDIYYLDSARLNLGLYQSDVNVLWDLAPHDVSIFNHLLGATPDTVTAWGTSHAHSIYEDVASVRLDYKALGVIAQLHVSWLDPCKVRRTTVVGSRQMAVYNDMSTDEKLRLYDKGVDSTGTAPFNGEETLHERPVTYRYGGITSPYLPSPEPLMVQDEHFVDCIRNGSTPTTHGENGLAVVKVLAAASIALREQRTVHIEELEV